MISLTLIAKNSVRKKMRFMLTVFSVSVAFYLFTTIAGIEQALTASIENSNQFRLMTNHKISLTRSLPLNYQQKIAQIDGVNQVAYASWFGGFYQDETNQLAVNAVSANNYFSLYPEYQLSEQALSNWQKNRIGIVIGETLANKFNWQVGDRVPLKSSIWMNRSGSFTWDFEVAAIYRGKDHYTNTNQVFFHHQYFDKARAYARYSATWMSTQVAANANVDQVAASIDALFANATEATRTTTEQVFIKEQAQQFIDMANILTWVVMAVFFTLMLIVCNTMVLTIRERLNEIAMMKALGFSSAELIEQIFLESLLLLSLGALIGALLAMFTIGQIQTLMADFLPGIRVLTTHFYQLAGLVLLSAIICSAFPAVSIKRLTISSTLGGA